MHRDNHAGDISLTLHARARKSEGVSPEQEHVELTEAFSTLLTKLPMDSVHTANLDWTQPPRTPLAQGALRRIFTGIPAIQHLRIQGHAFTVPVEALCTSVHHELCCPDLRHLELVAGQYSPVDAPCDQYLLGKVLRNYLRVRSAAQHQVVKLSILTVGQGLRLDNAIAAELQDQIDDLNLV
jgi:hypothetical protein